MFTKDSDVGDSVVLSPWVKEAIKTEIMNNIYAGRGYDMPLKEPYRVYYGDKRGDVPGARAIPQWINDMIGPQGEGMLYGIGTIILIGMLLPSFGEKVQGVITRSASEGVRLMGEARSVVARAREDIEDIIAEAGLKFPMGDPEQRYRHYR